jgi:hypothetical protein
MSAFGGTRTSRQLRETSAFDPKRTSHLVGSDCGRQIPLLQLYFGPFTRIENSTVSSATRGQRKSVRGTSLGCGPGNVWKFRIKSEGGTGFRLVFGANRSGHDPYRAARQFPADVLAAFCNGRQFLILCGSRQLLDNNLQLCASAARRNAARRRKVSPTYATSRRTAANKIARRAGDRAEIGLCIRHRIRR